MKVTKLGNGCELREYASGDKYWRQNGELHRVGEPAAEFVSGGKYWFQNGKKHRVDGPAAEYADGSKEWYQNGQLHRVDGPAIEHKNGTKGWWIKGKQLTEAEFNVHPLHQSYLFDREVERVLNDN